VDAKSLEKLARRIQHCQKCERNRTRRHSVPGEGNPDSGMLVLGEAPGKKEDDSGRPFVGRAGNYLENILSGHELKRGQVFITSVLKCYHPQPPERIQVRRCLPWTLRQIDALNPRLVLVMGKWAAWALLGMENLRDVPLALIREGRDWVVSCHPAAAMRFPERDKQFREGFRIFASRAGDLGLLPPAQAVF
jgi:uracil-DNA glycosylase family 4